MTTMEDTPSLRHFVAMRLARYAMKKREAKEGTRAQTLLQTILRLVLHLAGFGCLTLAGFTWNMAAGLVVAGLSFFALSWLSTSSEAQQVEVRSAPDLRTGR